MDKNSTNSWKGLFAVMIILHHLALDIENLPVIFIWLRYIGFSLVGYYFFLSGYGLYYSYKHKEGYLDGFLQKRLPKVLVPYFLMEVVWLVYYLVTNQFKWGRYIQEIFVGNWFVTIIVLFYIAFWLAYRYLTEEQAFAAVCGAAILIFIVTMAMGIHSKWSASLSAFPMGIWICKNWDAVHRWLNEKYKVKTALLCVIFAFFYLGRMLIQMTLTKNLLLHSILRNIVVVAFIMALLAIQQRLHLSGKIFDALSKIYYELYLTHFFALQVMKWRVGFGGLMLTITTIIMSVVSAYLLSILAKQCLKSRIFVYQNRLEGKEK